MVEGVMPHARLIPQRGSDHSRKANRVQFPSGSFNACRRREFLRRETQNRVQERTRRSTKIVDDEQLNDERGVKPLPVSAIGDGAELGTSRSEG